MFGTKNFFRKIKNFLFWVISRFTALSIVVLGIIFSVVSLIIIVAFMLHGNFFV